MLKLEKLNTCSNYYFQATFYNVITDEGIVFGHLQHIVEMSVDMWIFHTTYDYETEQPLVSKSYCCLEHVLSYANNLYSEFRAQEEIPTVLAY